ncbi:MAG: tRNA pseudouridine(55) synthase TruB [Actinomycetota bacterium]
MIGFVLVDKPRGPTSHDIVDRVRKALGVRRIGHAGTLDPPASGLLILGVGPATRLLRYAQDLQKTYDVTAQLGVRTATLDADGEIVSRSEVSAGPEDIRKAAGELTGCIEQVPPAVSAVKVGGERAYKKARRGEDVELAPRKVTVHVFEILRTSPTAFDARIVCSSGTYVRSLVADVGDSLGCGAHVVSLRRTQIGELTAREAVKPDAVTPACIRPVEDVLRHLPRIDVDADTASAARNGRSIEAQASNGEVLVVGPDGAVGVFEASDGILRPTTVLGKASD